jgi:hypothetical protein
MTSLRVPVPPGRKSTSERTVLEKPVKRVSKCLRVALTDDQPCHTILNQLRDTSHVCSDNCHSLSKRFDQHIREAVPIRLWQQLPASRTHPLRLIGRLRHVDQRRPS